MQAKTVAVDHDWPQGAGFSKAIETICCMQVNHGPSEVKCTCGNVQQCSVVSISAISDVALAWLGGGWDSNNPISRCDTDEPSYHGTARETRACRRAAKHSC